VLRPVGVVEIDPETCKGCGFCIEFCPLGILEFSDSINKMGYQYPRVKPGYEELCVCCGMCERVCPELAIRVREKGYVEVEVLKGVK
jgi:2-oxoglutarate ferredoxin oxidoreductase subunit delta